MCNLRFKILTTTHSVGECNSLSHLRKWRLQGFDNLPNTHESADLDFEMLNSVKLGTNCLKRFQRPKQMDDYTGEK